MIKTGFLLLISCGLLYGCANPSSQTTQYAPATAFAGLYFSPTNGKVGYHMVSDNFFSQNPCTKDEFASVGKAEGGITTAGTIPPGLMPPDVTQGRFTFEGTPRQAGDWDVTVTMHYLSCAKAHNSDGPVNYGDQTATVHFHIDP
jgi:hypothetical protein